MMKWFVNECRDFQKTITEKLDGAITAWAKGQIEDAERLKKLEGELRALKARMGKKPAD
jgi:hypothetical protein